MLSIYILQSFLYEPSSSDPELPSLCLMYAEDCRFQIVCALVRCTTKMRSRLPVEKLLSIANLLWTEHHPY